MKNAHVIQVNFGKDYIHITDGVDDIAYWDIQEWEEDPEVVFSIANAVKLAYTNPEELLKLLGLSYS